MENNFKTDKTSETPGNGNQVITSEYLRKNTNLSAMQIIFLVTIVVGGIASLIQGVQTYNAYDSSGFRLPYRELWLGLNIVCFLASAYIVWCFVKRKPNAVHVAVCYLTGLLFSTILLMVLVYLNAEHTYRGSGAVALQNAGFQVFSIIATIFWLIYLSASVKMDVTCPKTFRKGSIIDYVILALMIGIPVYLFSQCYIP